MNAISKKSMKKPEQEDRRGWPRSEQADRAPRQVRQQVLDPHVAVEPLGRRARTRSSRPAGTPPSHVSRMVSSPSVPDERSGESSRPLTSARTMAPTAPSAPPRSASRCPCEDAAQHHQDEDQRREQHLEHTAARGAARSDRPLGAPAAVAGAKLGSEERHPPDVERVHARQHQPGVSEPMKSVADAHAELIGRAPPAPRSAARSVPSVPEAVMTPVASSRASSRTGA